MSINKAILKVAQENPEFRKALTAELKKARRSVPLLQMKYQNLGDFGGTNRSLENWILEVGGPTYRIKDDLKRYKMRWEPQSKTWRLSATLYAAGMMGRPAQQFARIRKLQEAAYKGLKPIIAQENQIIKDENKGILGETPKLDKRQLLKMITQHGRIFDQLGNYGIDMTFDWPNRYSQAGTEALAVVGGNTFDIKSLLKKFGFNWSSGKKVWVLPVPEYEAVKRQFLPALMRALKTGKTAKRAETPLEKAVWTAWEEFQSATDRYDYLGLVGGVGLSAVTSEAADYDQKIYDIGRKIERAAKAMERQSRSWRSAYNLSLEDKIQLDGKRLAKDLGKTKVSIEKAEKMMLALAKAYVTVNREPEYKDTAKYEAADLAKAIAKSKTTGTAFDRAIKLAMKA
jgi:hypothetical protein